AQAQRALDAVAGVDLNPFAVEIARFRLLLAALQAAGETRLAAAPDFRFQLAVGDSLLHGRHYGQQGDFAETLDVGFQRRLRHHYATEDTAAIETILGRQYHAVVGNPPYITPKDPAMRDAYREIYTSCHMKYGLGAPFIERFFELAQTGTPDQAAGFVGLIVANSFMKREFGSKLIKEVLPRLDLTHVVDCSGAYIPGHGTPTAILFGRHRAPVAGVVRTVRGIRGEPATPEDPTHGHVWTAILAQADLAESVSNFISTEDTQRAVLAQHPWNMGGGGAAEVQEAIEGDWPVLGSIASEIGITSVNGEDEAYTFEDRQAAERLGIRPLNPLVVGDVVRDYRIVRTIWAIWPHGPNFKVLSLPEIPNLARHLWTVRTFISKRKRFGTPMIERGLSWYEFQELYPSKLRTPLTITFAFVSTHNHFVLDRGGKVFNRTAPVIKLRPEASEDDHLRLISLLNSSTACFWLKQTLMDRGNGGIGGGIANEPWERFYEHDSTKVARFPIAVTSTHELGRTLDNLAREFTASLPEAICARVVPTRATLDTARATTEHTRGKMIALQEEFDWHCYNLYGLNDNAPEHSAPPLLGFGERAFEIVMARRIAAGMLETAWFTRHGSTPITDLPAHWPDDYRSVVEQRIALIETDATIGLVERPEFKRRWSLAPRAVMERDALRVWLLDRLESPHFWPTAEPRLTSTGALADAARHDADFVSVAALYAGETVNLDALVAELVVTESVPFLSVLRYSESGLRKRADWEATWTEQREEDAIDADLAARRSDFQRAAWTQVNPRADDESDEDYAARLATGLDDESVGAAADRAIATEAARRKSEEIGPIAVPPKYKPVDFLSQDFWRLRGGLDVSKERFVSFPHAVRDADGSLPVLWAGFDTLVRARAIAGWYVARKDEDGWAGPRLVPLLAGLLDLVPWLRQWHNLLLAGNVQARGVKELAGVVTGHDRWLNGKRFLMVPFHMIGAHDVESAILGGYAEHVRRLHPQAPTPGVYLGERLFDDARGLRATLGDAAFFAKLNANRVVGASDGWGDIAAEWDAGGFDAAALEPPKGEERQRLIGDLIGVYFKSYAEVASARGEAFVDLDTGLAIISRHAQALGYDAVVLFLDELILWLATRAADVNFVSSEGAKLSKLVEAQHANRPIPIISFVARQRDLRELVGEHQAGALQLQFADTLKYWEARFDKVMLEDRNLPVIAERRLLRPKSEAAKQEMDAAFESFASHRRDVLETLLGSDGERELFRKTYPFSPALVQALIAASSVLQRERTALKLMLTLLVKRRDELRLGSLLPVGDLWDEIAIGEQPFSDGMRIQFDNAKRLWTQKLLPMLEQSYGVAWQDMQEGRVAADKARPLNNDARLLKTLLLAALVPALGGKVGVAPRLYLRKLVTEVLDRVDQFSDFDPRRHYAPTLDPKEMSAAERAAAGAASVDDIELDA
ncbi:MAG: hypothetical protein QOF22_38, partial [Bradyrhizobium sp.]|nr:hypothetical protein [Bradyrhizobium sp.]